MFPAIWLHQVLCWVQLGSIDLLLMIRWVIGVLLKHPLIVWLLLKLPSERRTRKGCWRPVETSTGQLFTHIGMTNIKIFVCIFLLFFPQVAMQRISRSRFQTERRSASSTNGPTFCLTLSDSLRVSRSEVVELSPMPQVPSQLGSLK